MKLVALKTLILIFVSEVVGVSTTGKSVSVSFRVVRAGEAKLRGRVWGMVATTLVPEMATCASSSAPAGVFR